MRFSCHNLTPFLIKLHRFMQVNIYCASIRLYDTPFSTYRITVTMFHFAPHNFVNFIHFSTPLSGSTDFFFVCNANTFEQHFPKFDFLFFSFHCRLSPQIKTKSKTFASFNIVTVAQLLFILQSSIL